MRWAEDAGRSCRARWAKDAVWEGQEGWNTVAICV